MVEAGRVTDRIINKNPDFEDERSRQQWLRQLHAQLSEILYVINQGLFFDTHEKDTRSISGGASYVLPAGTYVIQPGINTKLQFDDAGWIDITAIGVGVPHVESDGVHYRLTNTSGGSENSLIFKKSAT